MDKVTYEKQLFENILASMEKHGLNDIGKSVILTGSFGRGEATYENSDDGVLLKSDVEIGIVYKASKRKINKLINDVKSEFVEDLNLMPFEERRLRYACNFNKTLIPPKYKTLFTYDLFNGSKVIWGEDYLSYNQIELSAVDIYEAKRIVANRIGELIYISHNNPDCEIIWKNKLILAIASAYLLYTDKYASSYHRQRDELMNSGDEAENVLGKGFCRCYNEAFEFLRENGLAADISYTDLRKYVKNVAVIFNKNEKPRVNSFCRTLKYYIKYFCSKKRIGFFNIEDKIISLLIESFIKEGDDIYKAAELWHNILY